MRVPPARTTDARFRAEEGCGVCFATVEGASPEDATAHAAGWLALWMAFQKRCRNAGAAVFDVDDTLLTHRHGGEAPLAPCVALYNRLRELGFACCIVTARPDYAQNRDATVAALRRLGVDGWESLYMMPPPPRGTPCLRTYVSDYKARARADVATRHRLLCSVGDCWHDVLDDATIREPLRRRVAATPVAACVVCFPGGGDAGEHMAALKLPNFDA